MLCTRSTHEVLYSWLKLEYYYDWIMSFHHSCSMWTLKNPWTFALLWLKNEMHTWGLYKSNTAYRTLTTNIVCYAMTLVLLRRSFETEAMISPSDVETKGEDLPQISTKIVQQICQNLPHFPPCVLTVPESQNHWHKQNLVGGSAMMNTYRLFGRDTWGRRG